MSGLLLNTVFYFVVSSLFIYGIYCLLKLSYADLKSAKLLALRKQTPNARRYRLRPLVSVIVYSDDLRSENYRLAGAASPQPEIIDTLNSLTSGSYKKIQVIVADNASRPDSLKAVRKFIKDSPKKGIILYAKKKRTSKQQVFKAATKKVSGEYVIFLDAGQVVQKDSLKNTVLELADAKNHTASAVSPLPVRLGFEQPYTVRSLGNLLSILTRRQDLKLAYIYEKSAISSLVQHARMVNMLTILRFTEVVLAGFMIYVALYFDNPSLFLLAYMGFSSLLLLSTLNSSALSRQSKIAYLALLPAAYFIYLVGSLSSLIRPLRFRPY